VIVAKISHSLHSRVLSGIATPVLSALLLLQSGVQPPVRVPTNIVWNEETIAGANAGNAVRGLVLSRRCERCHGPEGFSLDPSTPNLAGMDRLSSWKQLMDFRSGKRQSPFMQPIAAALAEPDFADLAAYYAMLPAYADPQDQRAFPQPVPDTLHTSSPARIIAGGDGSRGIPPCQACHGPLAKKNGAPSLITQNANYIQEQLDAFAHGTRSNDIDMSMRAISNLLTAEERQAIGAYYGAGLANYRSTPSNR
jgi:cytochrome c553